METREPVAGSLLDPLGTQLLGAHGYPAVAAVLIAISQRRLGCSSHIGSDELTDEDRTVLIHIGQHLTLQLETLYRKTGEELTNQTYKCTWQTYIPVWKL